MNSEQNVPRGTFEIEPEPEFASELFGESLPKVREFTDWLIAEGELRGLIGPLELARIWTRHTVNSGLMAKLIKPGALVADIGSGAGLPGIVLAILRPDAKFVLIEPMLRRTEWLNEVIEKLELRNVTVSQLQAQDYPHKFSFDQITARAVSALSKLIPMCMPLLKSDGELIFLKGGQVAAEMDAALKQRRKYKFANEEIILLGEEYDTELTRVYRATLK